MSKIKPRPSMNRFIQLPKNHKIVTAQTYRLPHKKYPKWKFWRNEEVRYGVAVVTTNNRVYLIDPEAETVEDVTHHD